MLQELKLPGNGESQLDKLSYQIILVTHKEKDPESNIVLRRKLHKLDQPFRLLLEQPHPYLCQSLLIDYAFSTQENAYVTQVLISDALSEALQRFDREFEVIRIKENGNIVKQTLKINAQGLFFSQPGSKDRTY